MIRTTREPQAPQGRGAALNRTGELPAHPGAGAENAEVTEVIEEIKDRRVAPAGTVEKLAEVVVMLLILYGLYSFFLADTTIVGTAMEPALLQDQQLLVSRATYLLSPPQRGDVVIVRDPMGSGRIITRRVVGLPGEKVEVRGRQVIINNRPINEPYVNTPLLASESLTSTTAVQLRDDELYVLTDNRLSLSDSRTWGPVKLDGVVGRAWLIFWPPDSIGIITHERYSDNPTP